jgi:hypothetical protein
VLHAQPEVLAQVLTAQLVTNVSSNQIVVKSPTTALPVPAVTFVKSTNLPQFQEYSPIHANLVYSANNSHQPTTLVFQSSSLVPSVTVPANVLTVFHVLTALALPSKLLVNHVTN